MKILVSYCFSMASCLNPNRPRHSLVCYSLPPTICANTSYVLHIPSREMKVHLRVRALNPARRITGRQRSTYLALSDSFINVNETLDAKY